jgi:glycosyltransferase involved in cell wall biosynthesis
MATRTEGVFRAPVAMVGFFPGPICGMAVINAAVRRILTERGGLLLALDVAPGSLARTLRTHLHKFARTCVALARFWPALISGGAQSVYLSLSGGYGQLYDFAFLLLARIHGRRIFIHHHSFAYLSIHRNLTRVIAWICGPRAVHIVACEYMGSELRARYPRVRSVRCISGAAVVDAPPRAKAVVIRGPSTIGFLSNISADKGIYEFLDVVARLQDLCPEMRALIAGPFVDAKTERRVGDRVRSLPSARYVGPKYGDEKLAFYDEIDVLLFPTRYATESEGLVIHEAMARGAPVIASRRACIPSIITRDTGAVVPTSDAFADVATEHLLRWREEPRAYHLLSVNAREAFKRLHERSKLQLETMCSELLSTTPERATGLHP